MKRDESETTKCMYKRLFLNESLQYFCSYERTTKKFQSVPQETNKHTKAERLYIDFSNHSPLRKTKKGYA